MAFPLLPDLAADQLEQQLLATWKAEDLFRQSLAVGKGGTPFVFFEGPPTANGRPGIHHVFSRTIKDLVCRFRAMQGRSVTRIAGWDTHGLPVEIEVEKQLGLKGKKAIEEYGVERFNALCRSSVFTYKAEWETLSDRIGYWLDYDRPYITFSSSTWNRSGRMLRRLDDRGLLYRAQGPAVLSALRHRALEPRAGAQGYMRAAGNPCSRSTPRMYSVCTTKRSKRSRSVGSSASPSRHSSAMWPLLASNRDGGVMPWKSRTL